MSARVNIYRVTYHTIFSKNGREVRRTSPSSVLAIGLSTEEAFGLVPVPEPDEGEKAQNVNLGVQLTNRGVLSRERIEAT